MARTKFNPLQLLLSTFLNSQTNAGSAGGTMYYINIGGIKFLWGISASVALASGSNNLNWTLPTSFFSTIQYCTAGGVTSPSSTLYGYIAAFSTTTIQAWFTSGAAQTCQGSVFVIGT